MPTPRSLAGATAAPSTEVVLHELGESVGASLASIQAELARYPNAIGAFVVDEIELTIPVAARVDDVGQVLVRVLAPEPAEPAAPARPPSVSEVRLLVRPVLGAAVPLPHAAREPVELLGDLAPAAVAMLQARRIFSVDDLQRVARTAAGRAALTKLGISGSQLNDLLDRSMLLLVPELPARVARALLQTEARTPAAFIKADPERLAADLSARLGQPVTPDAVRRWQQDVTAATRIDLSQRLPGPDVRPVVPPLVVTPPVVPGPVGPPRTAGRGNGAARAGASARSRGRGQGPGRRPRSHERSEP